MPVPHCFDYHSFAVSFKIRKCEISNFVLFFFPQDCFGYSGSLETSYGFRTGVSTYIIGILTGIALNLQMALGSIDILAMLSLPFP